MVDGLYKARDEWQKHQWTNSTKHTTVEEAHTQQEPYLTWDNNAEKCYKTLSLNSPSVKGHIADQLCKSG